MSSLVWALSPTSAQIEQFKQLPPEQQRQLAKSYGIELPSAVTATKAIEEPIAPAIEPRTTLSEPEEIEPKNSSSSQTANKHTDEQEKKTQLKRFGYELFAGAPTTFAQVANVPVPSNYTLGPGDTLKVQLFGKISDQFELQIDRDGHVDFPELGPIYLAGQTFSEARQTLHAHVKEQIIGGRISISMGELRSIQVFVLGDAFTPGLYTISALSNISHALYQSGGIANTGSLRHIQLKRSGAVVAELDLYDLLLKGDTSHDARLMPGDVIFIPPSRGAVAVDGEVRRPAIYEIKQGETIADAVRMAGGLLPDAYPKKSVLTGYDDKKIKQVTSLDLTQPDSLQKPLASGDYIKVRTAKESVENGVLLLGAVAHPGFYAHNKGMRVSELLPSIEESLLSETDLDYALVVTERSLNRGIRVRQFNLGKALTAPGSSHDLILGNKDKVIIFNRLGVIAAQEEPKADELLHLANATPAQHRALWADAIQPTVSLTSSMKRLDLTGNIDEHSPDKQDLIFANRKKEVVFNHLGDMAEQEPIKSEDLLGLHNATPAQRRNLLAKAKRFNRSELLKPLIQRLKSQAKSGELAQIVMLTGAVKEPGIYPLAQGATLTELVAAAGGLTEFADITKAEISRTKIIEGESADYMHFSANLAKAQQNSAQDPALHPKDIINVMTVPAWRDNPVITVKGEVKHPGTYTLKRGETIMDVLARVGGLTNFADLNGVVFTRESIRQRQKEQLSKLVQQLRKQLASLSLRTNKGSHAAPLADYETMQKLIADMSAVEPVGRLVIDMPAIVSGNSNYNVQLEHGDALYVPPKRNSINVIGEVQLEGTHFYSSKLDLKEYLTKSGGIKAQADDKRIYIVKASGDVIIPHSYIPFVSANAKLEPGDTVVVPLNLEYMDGLTLWSTATGILYNTAVALAAIGSL